MVVTRSDLLLQKLSSKRIDSRKKIISLSAGAAGKLKSDRGSRRGS
jgi:hypothetical protein